MKQYGVDVASYRLDDLDTLLLDDVEKIQERDRGTVTILDIGCGAGGLTKALLEKQCIVDGVDIADVAAEVFYHKEFAKRARFFNEDMYDFLVHNEMGYPSYTCIVLQRVLHYVPYQKTLLLLKECLKRSEHGVYVSLSGIESEISRYYLHTEELIQNRFSYLNKIGQEKFCITAPICLYSKQDVKDIISTLDCTCEYYRMSAFGNHKCKLSSKK